MLCIKCKQEIPNASRYCNLCGASQEEKKKKRRTRRANGNGTVFKLSGKRAKPWCALRGGVESEDGSFQRRTIGTFATKAEAEQAVLQDKLMPASDYSNITLSELFDMWKLTRAYTDISKQTQDNYNAAYKYLYKFHSYKFGDLRTVHFQNAIDEAEAKGKSRSTLEKIKALCTLLSKFASSQDIIRKSYTDTLKLPKSKKKTIPTFTEVEIAKLFKNEAFPIVDTILILIYTGMRITELLTLTKFNVNIEEMLIVGGVKTEAGEDRTIPIHPKIQHLVLKRYNESENYLIEEEVNVGNKKTGIEKVIRKKFNYEHYCDLYYNALDKLKIRRLTPHKARHTFFTMLSDKCQDRKGIALVGGHTDPAFTEKTYVQPDIDRLRKVIECL